MDPVLRFVLLLLAAVALLAATLGVAVRRDPAGRVNMAGRVSPGWLGVLLFVLVFLIDAADRLS